jgi:hypothetical protein
MKVTIFRDVMPCSLVAVYGSLIDTYSLKFHVLRYSMQVISRKQQAFETGDNTFLRNVDELYSIRRRHISEDKFLQ